jgi:hypothetical protein
VWVFFRKQSRTATLEEPRLRILPFPSLPPSLPPSPFSQMSDDDGATAAPSRTASSLFPRRAAAAKKAYQEPSEEEESEIELADEYGDDDFEA